MLYTCAASSGKAAVLLVDDLNLWAEILIFTLYKLLKKLYRAILGAIIYEYKLDMWV